MWTKAYRPDVKQLQRRNIDTSLLVPHNHSRLISFRRVSFSPLLPSLVTMTSFISKATTLWRHRSRRDELLTLVPSLLCLARHPPHHIYRKAPSASRKRFDPRRHAPLPAIPVRWDQPGVGGGGTGWAKLTEGGVKVPLLSKHQLLSSVLVSVGSYAHLFFFSHESAAEQSAKPVRSERNRLHFCRPCLATASDGSAANGERGRQLLIFPSSIIFVFPQKRRAGEAAASARTCTCSRALPQICRVCFPVGLLHACVRPNRSEPGKHTHARTNARARRGFCNARRVLAEEPKPSLAASTAR